jgi:hypothetical protein
MPAGSQSYNGNFKSDLEKPYSTINTPETVQSIQKQTKINVNKYETNIYQIDSLLTKYLTENMDKKLDSLFKKSSVLISHNQQQLKNDSLLYSKLTIIDSNLRIISDIQTVTCNLLDTMKKCNATIQSLNKEICRTKRIAATAAVLSGLSLATATSFYFIMSNNKHSSNTNEVIIEW